jgi:hypothetical protein
MHGSDQKCVNVIIVIIIVKVDQKSVPVMQVHFKSIRIVGICPHFKKFQFRFLDTAHCTGICRNRYAALHKILWITSSMKLLLERLYCAVCVVKEIHENNTLLYSSLAL